MKYQIITLNTVWNKDQKMGGLSFVESERDIPFAIKRMFCIYKTEMDQYKRYYAYEHKNSWQLIFCPYGEIDIILTNGKDTETETITLNNPSKGLIISPGFYIDMNWHRDDSVLCVATSEYLTPEEEMVNDKEYLSHIKKYYKDNNLFLDESNFMIEEDYLLGVKKLKFPSFPELKSSTNPVGTLSRSIIIEGLKDVPFKIKRIFFIFGEGNVGLVRGKHANRKSEFVLFNISGQSKVKVIDEDMSEKVYELNEPKEALYLPRMIWKEMYDFTSNAVLMVVTNEYYDGMEYIRDFDTFAEEIRELKKKWAKQ